MALFFIFYIKEEQPLIKNDAYSSRLSFTEKMFRYCHHSGVVDIDCVVVVTNFNLGYNFKVISVEANLLKLNMLVHHHKGYNLT